MNTVFIVDAKSEEMAADLNAIAKREKVAVRFTGFASPERLFRELNLSIPDLVLLHHHWPGIKIGELLGRIADADDTIRVIVFTGQSLDVSELIECVRFGAADYWTDRGRLDHDVVFRKIDQYCHNSSWTVKTLRMPSGSVSQLLSKAESSIEEREALECSITKLKGQLHELQSEEHRAMNATIISALKVVFNLSVFTGAFVVVNRYTTVGVFGSSVLIAIFAVFFLFLEGRLVEALFKWNSGSAALKGK